MKLNLIIYLFCEVSFLSSCSVFDNDATPLTDDDVPLERIDFNVAKSSSSQDWIYCESIQIDLSQYNQIDSILFVPNLRSQTREKKCIAELFNFSLDAPVNNSQVTSIIRYTLHFVKSKNIATSLKHEPTNVGIRFRSSQEGHHVEIGVGSHLLIYYR